MNHDYYRKKAEAQHNILVKIKPKRGVIYDRKNRVLALDTNISSVYAVSRRIENKEEVASKIADALNIEKSFVLERLRRDKLFVWVKRQISDTERYKIENLGLPGVALIEETKRSYPNHTLCCHVIGFTDLDNKGLEGLELYYDSYLKGRYGWISTLRDGRRKIIPSHGEYLPDRAGYDLVLTIDEVIQHIIEDEIMDLTERYDPASVSIIAMDPKTGEILGMSAYPNYDLNRYNSSDPDMFKNRPIQNVFEPGSTFKIITAAALINEGLVKENEVFYCEKGRYIVGRRVLHDYKPYGKLSFREIVEKSSNIGVVKAAERLGSGRMYDYVKKFGFGSRTGIDLPGEEYGIVRPEYRWTASDMTTIPMGHGISCTSIQLASAVSVIANGGNMMMPYMVKYVTGNKGDIIKERRPRLIRRVIEEDAAALLKSILRGVVENGTGHRADMDGYISCGKTGTAEKVLVEKGGYSKDKFIASFVGFAPYEDPKVTLVVVVDEPKKKHYGGIVAAPAFRDIMQKVLKYMEIKHDKG